MKGFSPFLVSSLVAVATAFVGCGGTDGDAAPTSMGGAFDTGPSAATDCSADDDYELLLIDDFELGAATGAFTNNEVCDDCQHLDGEDLFDCQDLCRASQSPTDYDKPLPGELIPDGRCGSRYALHVESQSFHDWGGVVGFPFAPAIDVRDYDGVSFWGRVAWGSRSTIRASVLDAETDATFVDPETGEPRCSGVNDLDEFQEACDPYGGFTVMTGDWQFFRVPFTEMRQRGYGHIAPFLDVGGILQVSVEFGLGEWDFWVDDVAFYREKGGAQ